MKSRVLVLIADEICGRCAARELADRGAGPEGTSVVVIAPALLHSAREAWADDIDADIAEAERKVDAAVALLQRQGYAAIGKVGDSNPKRAIEDGLAEFPSDTLIVVTHRVNRMGRVERQLIDWLARDGTGDISLVMTPDSDFPQADDGNAATTEHPITQQPKE